MQLTQTEIARFREQGFLVIPEPFTGAEIAVLCDALPALYAEQTPANVREKRSGKINTKGGLRGRGLAMALRFRHASRRGWRRRAARAQPRLSRRRQRAQWTAVVHPRLAQARTGTGCPRCRNDELSPVVRRSRDRRRPCC